MGIVTEEELKSLDTSSASFLVNSSNSANYNENGSMSSRVYSGQSRESNSYSKYKSKYSAEDIPSSKYNLNNTDSCLLDKIYSQCFDFLDLCINSKFINWCLFIIIIDSKYHDYSQIIIATSCIALAREKFSLKGKLPSWFETIYKVNFSQIKEFHNVIKR